jgi:hypothetical protein
VALLPLRVEAMRRALSGALHTFVIVPSRALLSMPTEKIHDVMTTVGKQTIIWRPSAADKIQERRRSGARKVRHKAKHETSALLAGVLVSHQLLRRFLQVSSETSVISLREGLL